MKNNPVFQVLVVTSPTILPISNKQEDLAVGQLGVFDASTNLSVDIGAALPSKIYFAVGLANQAGTLGDIRKSAGEAIVKSLIKRVDAQPYTAPQAKVFSLDLAAFVPAADASTDYVLRFSFSSGQIMNLSGFGNPVKSFTVTAPKSMSLANFKLAIIAEVNKDEEGIIVAADAGSDVLTFTIGAEDKVNTVNGINKRYSFLRQLNAELSLSEEFLGKVATVSGPVYEEGSGYDIKQLEYVAGGWIGNPGLYRDSNLNGVLANEIMIYADAATNYWTIRFNYSAKYTSGGSLDYESILETVIAVPQTPANFAFINSLIAMVNTYVTTEGEVVTLTTTTSTTTTTTTTT